MDKPYSNSYRFSYQHPSAKGCEGLTESASPEKDYYDDASERFQPDEARFNGWGSQFSQVIRFDILIEEIRKNQIYHDKACNSVLSILDVGCGSGDLKRYLPADWVYNGIDKREDIEGENITGGVSILDYGKTWKFDGHIDYCVASGSMAFFEVPQVEEAIEKMLEIAEKGVVFNLLDAKSDYMGDEPVVHVQRKRFFSYIFNKYRIQKGYEVRMRTDYFPGDDFTIGIFKPF